MPAVPVFDCDDDDTARRWRRCPQPSRVFPRISLPKTMFRLCISCVPCRPQRRVDSQLIFSAAAHVLESFKNKTRQRTLQCIRRGEAAAFISCCCREPAPPLCLPPCICCVSVCVCVNSSASLCVHQIIRDVELVWNTYTTARSCVHFGSIVTLCPPLLHAPAPLVSRRPPRHLLSSKSVPNKVEG